MSLKIAIQPDQVVHPNGERQSFSTRWTELAQAKDIDVVPVDVFSGDAMACIAGCDAFMWRCPSSAHVRAYAKRFLYALEAGSGMPVFPSLKSSWYFEDKLAQRYFFNAAGIPCARTDIFWTREAAEQFCERAAYPFVLKLAGGHQSANVRLVRNRSEAAFYVDELFGHGVASLGYRPASKMRLLLRRVRAAAQTLEGHNPYVPSVDAELHYGYFYAQEFLPGNDSRFPSSSWATAPSRFGDSSNPVISARAAAPDAWIGILNQSAKMQFALHSILPGSWARRRSPWTFFTAAVNPSSWN